MCFWIAELTSLRSTAARRLVSRMFASMLFPVRKRLCRRLLNKLPIVEYFARTVVRFFSECFSIGFRQNLKAQLTTLSDRSRRFLPLRGRTWAHLSIRLAPSDTILSVRNALPERLQAASTLFSNKEYFPMVGPVHFRDEGGGCPNREEDPNRNIPVFSDFCLSLNSKPLRDGVPTSDSGEKWNSFWPEVGEVEFSADEAIAVGYPMVQFVELELPVADDRRRQAYDFFAGALSEAGYFNEAVGVRCRLERWFDHHSDNTKKIDLRSLQNQVELAFCYQEAEQGNLACEALYRLASALPYYVAGEGRSVDAVDRALLIAKSAVDLAYKEDNEPLCAEIYRAVINVAALPRISVDRALDGGWCDSAIPYKLESVWYVAGVCLSMSDSDSDLVLRAHQARLARCERNFRFLVNEDQTLESFPAAHREAKKEVAEAAFSTAKVFFSRGEYDKAAAALTFLLRFADAIDRKLPEDVFTLANQVIEKILMPGDLETEVFNAVVALYVAGFDGFPRMPDLHPVNSLNWILAGADFIRRSSLPLEMSEDAFGRAGERMLSITEEIPVELQCEYYLGHSAVRIAQVEQNEDESYRDFFYVTGGSETELALEKVVSLCSEAQFERGVTHEIMARCYLARFAQKQHAEAPMLKHSKAASGLFGAAQRLFSSDLLNAAAEIGSYLTGGGEHEEATRVLHAAYEAVCADFDFSRMQQASAALDWGTAEIAYARELVQFSGEANWSRAEQAIQLGFEAHDKISDWTDDPLPLKLDLLLAQQEILEMQCRFKEAQDLEIEIERLEEGM